MYIPWRKLNSNDIFYCLSIYVSVCNLWYSAVVLRFRVVYCRIPQGYKDQLGRRLFVFLSCMTFDSFWKLAIYLDMANWACTARVGRMFSQDFFTNSNDTRPEKSLFHLSLSYKLYQYKSKNVLSIILQSGSHVTCYTTVYHVRESN